MNPELRQLCRITTWLAIIGICQLIQTCRIWIKIG